MAERSKRDSGFGRRWRGVLAACILAAPLTAPAAAQGAPGEPAAWQALVTEIRSLRMELLRDRLERAHTRIAAVQQQLQAAQADRNQIGQQQQSQAKEIEEAQQLLSQPSLTGERREELEAHRTLLMSAGTARLAERASSAEKREAELREQLGREQTAGLQIVAALRQLDANAPRH
jgi:hypothetical protein